MSDWLVVLGGSAVAVALHFVVRRVCDECGQWRLSPRHNDRFHREGR